MTLDEMTSVQESEEARQRREMAMRHPAKESETFKVTH